MSRRYYSEHGEDVLLDRLFASQAEGFFVEVGCLDGRRYSNTLTFEERGWRGMCIEPHPDYTALLRANRPASIVCTCAAGATDADAVPFYANRWGSLSSLDRSREAEFKHRFGARFAGFDQHVVQQRRLDTLFHQYGIDAVDILSIDVEGTEAAVLQGIDFHRIAPTVILIEAEQRRFRRQIEALLLPAGYIRSVRFAQNIFYIQDRTLERRIWGHVVTVPIERTRHPLDSGPESVVQTTVVDTRRATAFKLMLMSRLQAVARSMTRLLFRRLSP